MKYLIRFVDASCDIKKRQFALACREPMSEEVEDYIFHARFDDDRAEANLAHHKRLYGDSVQIIIDEDDWQTFTRIPDEDLKQAIRGCYANCDAHACPYLATVWSGFYPAAFTGAPTRTRLCDHHFRLTGRTLQPA